MRYVIGSRYCFTIRDISGSIYNARVKSGKKLDASEQSAQQKRTIVFEVSVTAQDKNSIAFQSNEQRE
jgi:hypothetical protein